MRAILASIVITALMMVSVALWAFGETDSTVMFTGMEDHSISIQEAQELMRNYQDNATPAAKLGGFFGKETLQEILNQDGCVGIRYYYAEDADGNMMLILVGADAYGRDLVGGKLAERSMICPPWCSLDEEADLLSGVRVLSRVASK